MLRPRAPSFQTAPPGPKQGPVHTHTPAGRPARSPTAPPEQVTRSAPSTGLVPGDPTTCSPAHNRPLARSTGRARSPSPSRDRLTWPTRRPPSSAPQTPAGKRSTATHQAGRASSPGDRHVDGPPRHPAHRPRHRHQSSVGSAGPASPHRLEALDVHFGVQAQGAEPQPTTFGTRPRTSGSCPARRRPSAGLRGSRMAATGV